MKDEIKEILEDLRNKNMSVDDLTHNDKTKLLDCITNLQEENEHLLKQNNDLRKIYVNTSNRLFKNGNDELARYFQAQIDECPTFYVAPIIDYYKILENIKQDLDLELNKTRANDDYNNGIFNEALYIRGQIKKYEGDINAN